MHSVVEMLFGLFRFAELRERYWPVGHPATSRGLTYAAPGFLTKVARARMVPNAAQIGVTVWQFRHCLALSWIGGLRRPLALSFALFSLFLCRGGCGGEHAEPHQASHRENHRTPISKFHCEFSSLDLVPNVRSI